MFHEKWAGSGRAGFDRRIPAGDVSFAGKSGAEATALQTLRVCRATDTWNTTDFRKFFRRLTLCSATGFSQREKRHQRTIPLPPGGNKKGTAFGRPL
jgi:hypothetical protein